MSGKESCLKIKQQLHTTLSDYAVLGFMLQHTYSAIEAFCETCMC